MKMKSKGVGGGDVDDKLSGEGPDVEVSWLLGHMAESGDVGEFESLLETFPEVFQDMAVRTTNTPLHVAARMGHLVLVRVIMDRRPILAHNKNRHGLSPLHLAVESGHVDIVTELLSRDLGLCELRDGHGWTPLHHAAALGKEDVVRALIDTVTHLKTGQADSRRHRLSHKLIKDVTYRGETALHLAVKNKHNPTFQVLMRRLDQPEFKEDMTLNLNLPSYRKINKILYDMEDSEGRTVIQLARSNMYECAEGVDDCGWVGGRLYKFLFKDLKTAVFTLHNMVAIVGAAAGLYYGGDDEIFMFGKWLLILCLLTFPPLQALYTFFSWQTNKPYSQSLQAPKFNWSGVPEIFYNIEGAAVASNVEVEISSESSSPARSRSDEDLEGEGASDDEHSSIKKSKKYQTYIAQKNKEMKPYPLRKDSIHPYEKQRQQLPKQSRLRNRINQVKEEELIRKSHVLEFELEKTSKQFKEVTANKDVRSLTLTAQVTGKVPQEYTGYLGEEDSETLTVDTNESHTTNRLSSSSEANRAKAREEKTESKPQTEKTEWVQPGVYITFTSLPGGDNQIKRVRFSGKHFSPEQAEKWWAKHGPEIRVHYHVKC